MDAPTSDRVPDSPTPRSRNADSSPPAAASAASSSASSSAPLAKKRLLPMELRRRRRAAKLLGASSAATAASALDDPQAQAAPGSEEGAAPRTDKDIVASNSAALKRSAHSDPSLAAPAPALGDSVAATADGSSDTAAMPLSRNTSGVSRLNAFYNWSAADRKRQRLQNRALIDVPYKFHTAQLPVDMIPKAKMTILTAFPLPFLRLSAATKRKSIKPFAADPSEANETQPNDLRWHRALQYFAHPATPLPASITLNRMAVATKKDGAKTELIKDELEFYATRLRQWQEALRDVYFGFRGQEGSGDGRSSFYVRSSDFVSTARVRKALHHLNIAYATPYSSSSSTQHDIGRFHLLEAELVAMESQAAQSSTASARTAAAQQKVHGADSLLHFSGHQAIHGLYEFLINRKPLTKEDVPEIYALHPFANAAIKSLGVKYMGSVAAGLTSGSETTPAAAMFRTEISGFCFPRSVRELIEILADEYMKERKEQPTALRLSGPHQKREATSADESPPLPSVGIRVYMEPVTLTERFNSLHLSPAAVRMKTVSGTMIEERERWKQELELSKRRVENVVVRDALDEDEVFEVETTARAIS